MDGVYFKGGVGVTSQGFLAEYILRSLRSKEWGVKPPGLSGVKPKGSK
jgi:hypothetical protein